MSRSSARRSPSSSSAPASMTSMLVRSEVTGVRSSCEASATSRRCAACEACTRSSMASKRCAIRPTSSSPRAPMRRPRSPVASMCSAARVSSLIGPDDRPREQARHRARRTRCPTQHEQHEHDPQASEHGVDALQRAPELHRAQALDRHGDDAQVHAVGRAVGEERAPPAAAGGRAIAAGHADRQPAQAIAHDAVGPDDLRELGRPAGAPRRRGRRAAAQGADALHELALGAQPAIDLRAQLAAHGQVADERRERDRHAHGQRGHEHQAPAQGHGCSRST